MYYKGKLISKDNHTLCITVEAINIEEAEKAILQKIDKIEYAYQYILQSIETT